MERKDIEHLARLARIKVSEEEADDLKKDINAVLDYVSVINDITADTEMEKKVGVVHNVMREDEVTREAGGHTADLLNEAPDRDGNYLRVKKILQND